MRVPFTYLHAQTPVRAGTLHWFVGSQNYHLEKAGICTCGRNVGVTPPHLPTLSEMHALPCLRALRRIPLSFLIGDCGTVTSTVSLSIKVSEAIMELNVSFPCPSRPSGVSVRPEYISFILLTFRVCYFYLTSEPLPGHTNATCVVNPHISKHDDVLLRQQTNVPVRMNTSWPGLTANHIQLVSFKEMYVLLIGLHCLWSPGRKRCSIWYWFT